MNNTIDNHKLQFQEKNLIFQLQIFNMIIVLRNFSDISVMP